MLEVLLKSKWKKAKVVLTFLMMLCLIMPVLPTMKVKAEGTARIEIGDVKGFKVDGENPSSTWVELTNGIELCIQTGTQGEGGTQYQETPITYNDGHYETEELAIGINIIIDIKPNGVNFTGVSLAGQALAKGDRDMQYTGTVAAGNGGPLRLDFTYPSDSGNGGSGGGENGNPPANYSVEFGDVNVENSFSGESSTAQIVLNNGYSVTASVNDSAVNFNKVARGDEGFEIRVDNIENSKKLKFTVTTQNASDVVVVNVNSENGDFQTLSEVGTSHVYEVIPKPNQNHVRVEICSSNDNGGGQGGEDDQDQDHGPGPGPEAGEIPNMLWVYSEQYGKDHEFVDPQGDVDCLVMNGDIDIISIVYDGHTYSKDELLALGQKGNEERGDVWYEVNPGNMGYAQIPADAIVTVKLLPDYGYQVLRAELNESAIAPTEEQSVFTFTMPDHPLHLSAVFTPCEDEVVTSAKEIKAGAVHLAADEMDAGSALLTVEAAADNEAVFDKTLEGLEGYEMASCLDIGLQQVFYKGTKDDYWANSKDTLANKATISLSLSEEIGTEDVKILHEKHNGEVEIIDAKVDATTGTVSFETDSFSTYAIIKAETEEKDETDDKVEDKEEEKTPEEIPEKTDETKLVVNEGLATIPESLKNLGLDTEEKVLDNMLKVVVANDGYTKENTELFDVALQMKLTDGTWVDVTVENFPKEGVKVTLPYPEGTNKNDYEFVVAHMVTANVNGLKPGDVETPQPTLTDKGIEFTVKSLSPISISWKMKVSDSGNNNNSNNNSNSNNSNSDASTQVTPTEQNVDNTVKSPKTGDNTDGLYVLLLVACGMFVACGRMVLVKRKKMR